MHSRRDAILVAALVAAWAQAGFAGEIRSGRLLLEFEQQPAVVVIRLSDEAGTVFADGPAHYAIETPDGNGGPLKARVSNAETSAVEIVAKGGSVQVRHVIRRRAAEDGFEETITVTNTSSKPIDISDYQFALSRAAAARGNLRAVAVPFRRQADGRFRDYSVDEVVAGKGANSDWSNDRAVLAPEVIDTQRGRLRSEGWILTDGRSGLLVAKYNNDDIEYSHIGPAPRAAGAAQSPPDLLLGGSSFALYREPESLQRLTPGETVTLGTTYYLACEGGWPAGYERFRRLLNDLGHGLTADYDPPISWNELFDVGWYHSDAAALAKFYTRDALLREAAKAAEIGATALYLDPGWEVCEGTTRWGEDRLGPVGEFIRTVRGRFGLDVAFRTIGRVYRDEFPRDWYMQRTTGRPYERPSLDRPAAVEPVPTTDRGCRNLALLPAARASASSCLPGHAIHKVEHLNDGWYNNPASWISAGEPSWAQIDLGEILTIDRVRFGSEHTPSHRDRAAVHVRLLASAVAEPDAADWQLLAESDGEPVRDTRTFAFAPQAARHVRIEILSSTGGEARIDEVEVYEAAPHAWTGEPRRRELNTATTQPAGNPVAFWEVCTLHPAWQAEKLNRIEQITAAGMRFIMFDEFDWRGPCHAPDHGHAVPSTPEGHVRAVYGLVREIKRRVPGVLVEAHDPVWPWGVRYLPVYFDQTLDPARRPGSYDENWGFEFMWNPIEDLVSGRALCLYYYNLGCDIPLYDHITAENDNDACLAFWWNASTVRHLGIGGKKGLGAQQENETRWQAYKQAMSQYRRLRDYFVRGEFIGIDELAHLHVLAGKPGGVLVAFNLAETPVDREITIDPKRLALSETPAVDGARIEVRDGTWHIMLSIPPRSPSVLEIGLPARP